jgi:predicted AlkP superfamily pyrophosphatase or phosphodiesterase
MVKVILVLSDGLRYDVAVNQMGYLGHLVEIKNASLFQVIGELPSLSRPMYETVHTGLPVSQHGITTNYIVRKSDQPNIFQAVTQVGKRTGAAAYYWFSELYNNVPYDRIEHREVDDKALAIQHGRFYTEDDYPDIELFSTAEMLIHRCSPDYMLIHPMGVDYQGDKHGSDSAQYRHQILVQDIILAGLIPGWLSLGYTLLITGDHGVNPDGDHGGTTSEMRMVPLFIIQPGIHGLGQSNQIVSQLQLAPTILSLLNLPIPPTMKNQPIL